MSNTPSTPAVPTPRASFWHRALSEVSSIFDRIFKYAPAANKVVDAGLALSGHPEFVPAADAVFAGAGEIHEAAEKWMTANPSQPLTTEGIFQTLMSTGGLAGSTLTAIAQNVKVLSPNVAAKVAAAGAEVTAATAALGTVGGLAGGAVKTVAAASS